MRQVLTTAAVACLVFLAGCKCCIKTGICDCCDHPNDGVNAVHGMDVAPAAPVASGVMGGMVVPAPMQSAPIVGGSMGATLVPAAPVPLGIPPTLPTLPK